jgi:CheY-like chemotaxis protein
MILVLDDDPVRHRAFQQGMLGARVTHVHRADEALAALAYRGPWSVILLDHDLCDHGDDTAGNGMQVAKWIAGRTRHFKASLIVVHSINPVRGPEMVSMLKNTGLNVVGRPDFFWQNTSELERLVELDKARA